MDPAGSDNIANDVTLSTSSRTQTPNHASPALSFAESYTTARDSPYTPAIDQSPFVEPASPTSAQNLKKSMSVDSFARSKHENTAVRAHFADSVPNSKPILSRKVDAPSKRLLVTGIKPDPIPFSSGRDRGFSLSSVGLADEYGVDSDIERLDPLSSTSDRYRHTSNKGLDQTRPMIRGGELSLPSRAPALSATSSISSVQSTDSETTTNESLPRQQSFSSVQSLLGRSMPPPLPPGRYRSGSMGNNLPTNKKITVRTDVSESTSVVTLLVVGTSGCGKSTIIKKGLKGHDLDDSESIPVLSMQGTSTKYSRRKGVIRQATGPAHSLHVIEIDVPPEELDPTIMDWPQSLSPINGVVICYDSTNEDSFKPVDGLLRSYHAMKLPLIVLACKTDQEQTVDPERTLELLSRYDVGLVEVSKTSDQAKAKMRRTFDWVLKAVARDKRAKTNEGVNDYKNPASPGALPAPYPPWAAARSVTPTPASMPVHPDAISPIPSDPTSFASTQTLSSNESIPSSSIPPIENDSYPNDPPRTSSQIESKGASVELPEPKLDKDPRAGQWASLDELLDKLMFLAVSGDDQPFVSHFLLTYRRFATPRSVLLAMQKRMRQLDQASGDPMFACFAQMRICHLLEMWLRDYPHDFAVRGTAGALSAVVKSIISKTYLLHYGSELLPFLEQLPHLVDTDAAWAREPEPSVEEADDLYSLLEEETLADPEVGHSVIQESHPQKAEPPAPSAPQRERKPSIPLPFIMASHSSGSGYTDGDTSGKHQLKDLVRLAQEVLVIDAEEIAQEITRIEVKYFLDIKPRHWLAYTFVSGKKGEKEPISLFNEVSNRLADWVVSLILCHKSPRARVKQIEKMVEIAQRLRAMNNYSALRAFVAGINNATFNGDEATEMFRKNSPDHNKNLRSWEVLLQAIRSHRAYRLALRNTKGACIPALEVHISDLIRAHEGNDDLNSSDPGKIHWGKFNMMGRFISSTTQCQLQCRGSNEYNFPERPHIYDLLFNRQVMSDQMQKTRMGPVELEGSGPDIPLRRLFFW